MEQVEVCNVKFENIDKTLDKHDGEIEQLKIVVNKVDKESNVNITKLSTILEKLTEITQSNFETNQVTQKAVYDLTYRFDALNEDMCDLKDNASKFEEQGMFSIVGFAKDHLAWFIVGILGICAIGAYGIAKLTGLLP